MLKLASEPLVHFLLAGGLLFALYNAIDREPDVDPARQITVDDESLLAFLRVRSKTLATESIEEQRDRLTPEQLQQAIDDYVREEALFREAKAMGLDETDYGVRQRLVGQIEFINEGVVSPTITVSDEDLAEFLAQNSDRYRVPETVTLTHVFFNSDRHGAQQALQRAQAKLKEFQKNAVPFHEAPTHGDRFLYSQNYVKREAADIASQFGPEATRQIFSFAPSDAKWRGPLQSPYGYHLVLVTNKTASYVPEIEQLKEKLSYDVYQEKLQQEVRRIENSVIDSYEVQVGPSLQQRLRPAEDSP